MVVCGTSSAGADGVTDLSERGGVIMAATLMKRAAIQKADAVRGTKPVPDEIWADNEEMILKLSGLL